MNYELGKQYEMEVVDIRKDSAGHNYIALHDDDPSKEYRVYNILKCQYESLPETLYVTVKSIDVFGKIKFSQDIARLNKEHYHEGKLYSFDVIDVKEDVNTNAPYYIIEDDFTTHRYYFQGEQKYQKGGSCILEVLGVSDKGFLSLKEVEHPEDKEVEQAISEPVDNTKDKMGSLWDKLPTLEVGDESQTVEFKTTIVYPPGRKGEADIDKQLQNVIKELTAFMNTDGGTLYIGIHDKTKKILGIEDEFGHLNDDSLDAFSGSYKEDTDGYELKIRNEIDRLCPSLANSLISFSFNKLQGRTYCIIEVKPANRPIFLDGTQLFIRQGNRIKVLKGDEITFFIWSRMTVSLKDVIDTEGLTVDSLDVNALKDVLIKIINERKAIPKDLPKPKDLGEIDYWLVWYNGGTWKKVRNKSDEKNVYIQVPVYKNLNASLLVFCYETKVCTVKLNDFKKRANMNKLQTKNWWSRTGETPKQIFVVEPTDFIVGYSIDSNGIEYVKAHAISDYSPSSTAGAQGGVFVPDNARVETYAVVGAEHKKRIEHLIVKKADRSKSAGTPLSTPTYRDEIDYLEKILKAD